MDLLHLTVRDLPDWVLPTVAGVGAFSTTLCLSTLAQLHILKVSTATPAPIPTLIGIVTVCAASLASQKVAMETHHLMTAQPSNSIFGVKSGSMIRRGRPREETTNIEIGHHFIQLPVHSLRVCAVGLLVFKLLGGRFWAIAPSSYTHLGSFARWSLPATEKYASTTQRLAIEKMGRRVGCHTCGSRMLFGRHYGVLFHGDHQPPKYLAAKMNQRWFRRILGLTVQFRFYPQCTVCSNTQGSILSVASKMGTFDRSASAYFHGMRFRINHLTGGAVAALTVVDASDQDIVLGNRQRFRDVHETVENLVWNARAHVRKLLQQLNS